MPKGNEPAKVNPGHPVLSNSQVKPMLPSQAMSRVKGRLIQHVRVGNLQKKL